MVSSPRGRPPQFLRRVHNRPAVRRKGDLAVFAQLALVASGIAVGGALAYAGHDYVGGTEVFRIRELDVESVPANLREPVRQALADGIGANLLTVELSSLLARVDEIPQVAAARARRVFPDTLEVEIDLRAPWGVLRAADGQWRVSRDGVVLGEASAQDSTLPVLRTGVAIAAAVGVTQAVPIEIDELQGFADAILISEHLRALPDPPLDPDRLVLDPRGVIAPLGSSGWQVIVGDALRLDAKFADLNALLQQTLPEPGSEIDLRYRDMVVVRPPESGGSRVGM